ncbi:MAG: hypothetical protein LVQ75_02335 [Candidatus Babeliales bacterium]|jgi:hypothetical protein
MKYLGLVLFFCSGVLVAAQKEELEIMPYIEAQPPLQITEAQALRFNNGIARENRPTLTVVQIKEFFDQLRQNLTDRKLQNYNNYRVMIGQEPWEKTEALKTIEEAYLQGISLPLKQAPLCCFSDACTVKFCSNFWWCIGCICCE